jgi:putative inorganic carbon (HCO3(-)) transporter
MGFFFLVFYLFVSYIFPGEIFPALIPYHLTYWIGIGGLAAGAVSIFLRRGAPLRSVQLYLLLGFLGVMILSWISADRWLGAAPEAIQQFAPSLTMFLLTICSVDSMRRLKAATILMVALSLVIMAQGFAAYHFGINQRTFLFDASTGEELSPGADSGDEIAAAEPDDSGDGEAAQVKRIRGLGFLHDPNDLALGFVVALPLIGIGTGKSRFRTSLMYLSTAALCYGVFLTHSRGGTLGAAVVLLLTFATRLGRVRALLLVGILAIGAIALDIGGGRKFSAEDDSAAGRLDAWSEGLQMLKSQPIIGVGYRQFVEHNTLTAHNSFVLCFAETGLAGYFLWLSMLGVTLLQLQELKKLPGDKPVEVEIRNHASTLQHALFGFMAAAFFLSRTYIPLLYLLIGLCASLVLIARENDVPVALPSWPKVGTLIVAAELASIVLIYFLQKLQVRV